MATPPRPWIKWALVASLGLRREVIDVMPSPSASEWIALYERVAIAGCLEQPTGPVE